jgi:uncharacterized protein YbaR (Trm112 family)
MSTQTPQPDPLSRDDLKRLVCPVCHQSLALDAEFVRCNGCNPVLDGIPILLADRAS